MVKKLIRNGLGKLALWMVHLLREADKYADKPDKKFMKKVDEAEATIKELVKK